MSELCISTQFGYIWSSFTILKKAAHSIITNCTNLLWKLPMFPHADTVIILRTSKTY